MTVASPRNQISFHNFLSSPDLASVQTVGRPTSVLRLLAGHIDFGS
jgi:hypothetical protein